MRTWFGVDDVYEDPKKKDAWIVEAEVIPDGVEATELDIRSSRDQ